MMWRGKRENTRLQANFDSFYKGSGKGKAFWFSCTPPDILHGRQTEQRLLSRRQVVDVARLGQQLGNVLGGLQSTQLHQRLAAVAEGLRQQRGRLRVTLGANDCRLLHLLGLLHEETGALCLLLGDLLQLDGSGKLSAKGQMGLREKEKLVNSSQ